MRMIQKLKLFEAIIIRWRLAPFKTKYTPNFKMDWGHPKVEATYPEREKKEVQLFDIREFVKAKKKEKMEQMMNNPGSAPGGASPFGGMPGIADVGLDQEKALILLDGIYSTVVVRDILERELRRNQKKITDPILLKKITLYLADNIGSNISLSSVGNILVNEGLLGDYDRKTKPSTHTVQSYVEALLESYFFYEIKRFDIKGKEYLRTLGKYYIVDIGLRNYLLGFRNRDRGHALENIVYFELLRRGYEVYVGMLYKKEIDFVAIKRSEKIYIQISDNISDEKTFEREVSPLLQIKDAYPKMVIARTRHDEYQYEGIKVVDIADWLLDK